MADSGWLQIVWSCIGRYAGNDTARSRFLADRLEQWSEYSFWYKMYLMGSEADVRRALCMKIKALLGE